MAVTHTCSKISSSKISSAILSNSEELDMIDTNSNNAVLNFLNNIQSKVKENFTKLLADCPTPCPLLHQALEYTVLSDGKRLRAALVYSLTNGENSLLLDHCALAVELIHTYSLVHDDLPAMDNDDLRRGQPSCHIKFGEATAILVGDCLQSMAFTLLSYPQIGWMEQQDSQKIETSKLLTIIHILSQAIGHQGMVAGQSLELNQTTDLTNGTMQPLEQLNKIHYLKTGQLITASLQIAAVIHNFNQQQYQITTKLGDKLGLAFQIQDDLLDAHQTPEVLGKPALSDAKRGLPTYASVVSEHEGKKILIDLWSDCKNLVKDLEASTKDTYPMLNQIIEYIAQRQY